MWFSAKKKDKKISQPVYSAKELRNIEFIMRGKPGIDQDFRAICVAQAAQNRFLLEQMQKRWDVTNNVGFSNQAPDAKVVMPLERAIENSLPPTPAPQNSPPVPVSENLFWSNKIAKSLLRCCPMLVRNNTNNR